MRHVLTAVLLVVGLSAECAPWGIARGGGTDIPLASTDGAGAAKLTDDQLPPTTEEIVFLSPADGVCTVATFSLTNRTLRFSAAAAGVTLQTSGKESMFLLKDGTWTFDGLSFKGSSRPEPIHYHGGAIDCSGSVLTVTNCSFSNLGARFDGGAISARLMTGDVTLVDTVFSNNCAVAPNGTGGAVYASGVRGGTPVALTLAGCEFSENTAQNGGAVTTVCTFSDDETPVRLSVTNSLFRGNRAVYCGGAVDADGLCGFSATTFQENAAGLQGGAVNLGSTSGRVVDGLVTSGTVFLRNRVMDSSLWTCGGAIALWGDGSRLEIAGPQVSFDGNEALSGDCGFGGAVYASSGTVVRVSRTAFNKNVADDAGGAIYAWESDAAFSTCIFSNDTVTASTGSGGAIATDGASLAVTNTTVRFANRGAVSVGWSRVDLVNTLVADNGGDPDIDAFGSDSQLTMLYTAYGTAQATEEVLATIVTNDCISGVGSQVFVGDTLLLDVSTYNPVACEGLPQQATDYRNVAYGWQGDGSWSIGAYECPAPSDEPNVDLLSAKWFHNRADGLYYPQVTVRFLGGDASRLKDVTLTCGGTNYALPESCVERIRQATAVGQTFVFGVDDAHWVPSAGSQTDFGYIFGWRDAAEKATVMLFSVADATRAAVSVVGAANPISLSSTVLEVLSATPLRASPRRLSMSVPVPARFADFSVGDRLSGRAEALSGAQVTLYGCPSLGAAWQAVGSVELDADGRFSTEKPEGLRFFKLEAEVAR